MEIIGSIFGALIIGSFLFLIYRVTTSFTSPSKREEEPGAKKQANPEADKPDEQPL